MSTTSTSTPPSYSRRATSSVRRRLRTPGGSVMSGRNGLPLTSFLLGLGVCMAALIPIFTMIYIFNDHRPADGKHASSFAGHAVSHVHRSSGADSAQHHAPLDQVSQFHPAGWGRRFVELYGADRAAAARGAAAAARGASESPGAWLRGNPLSSFLNVATGAQTPDALDAKALFGAEDDARVVRAAQAHVERIADQNAGDVHPDEAIKRHHKNNNGDDDNNNANPADDYDAQDDDGAHHDPIEPPPVPLTSQDGGDGGDVSKEESVEAIAKGELKVVDPDDDDDSDDGDDSDDNEGDSDDNDDDSANDDDDNDTSDGDTQNQDEQSQKGGVASVGDGSEQVDYEQTMQNVFSENAGAPSTSTACVLPLLPPTHPLLDFPVKWRPCTMEASTFSSLDRKTRMLSVECKGKVEINFVSRDPVMGVKGIDKHWTELRGADVYRYGTPPKIPPEKWQTFTGPLSMVMNSTFAHIKCAEKPRQDNFRFQVLKNEAKLKELQARREKAWQDEMAKRPNLKRNKKREALSFLLIMHDSASRASVMRKNGLDKTKALLKELMMSRSPKQRGTTPHKHAAFVFNRMNSQGMHSGGNLVPLYGGNYLFPKDDLEGRRTGLFCPPSEEWIWETADRLGYISMSGGDTSNKLMGSPMRCWTCVHMMGTHAILKTAPHLNKNRRHSKDEWTGICRGDEYHWQHVFDDTEQFFDLYQDDTDARFAFWELHVQHVDEYQSQNQLDPAFRHTIKYLLDRNPNLVILFTADHGRGYSAPLEKHPASDYERLTPFSSVILPHWLLDEHPEFERNLFINQQRYMTHFDLHLMVKSLLSYPILPLDTPQYASRKLPQHFQFKGIQGTALNPLVNEIPRERGCDEAGIGGNTCICSTWKEILGPGLKGAKVVEVARAALNYINSFHTKIKDSSCVDLHLGEVIEAKKEKKNMGQKNAAQNWIVTFTTPEGPSTFRADVAEYSGRMEVLDIFVITIYDRFKSCRDPRVTPSMCVCTPK